MIKSVQSALCKIISSALCWLIFFGASALMTSVSAQVVVNEVMPDTTAANDASEWLELFNYTSQPIDLRGWKIDGQMVIGADPVQIPAFGFKIVTKDLPAFGTEFGAELPAIQLPISLRNSSDEVVLENTNNSFGVVDRLSYATVNPAKSWERKGPGCTDLVAAAPSAAARNSAATISCFPAGTQFPDIELSLDGQAWQREIVTMSPATIYFHLAGVSLSDVTDLFWSDTAGVQLQNPLRLNGQTTQTVTATFLLSGQQMRLVSRPIIAVSAVQITEFMPDPDGADSDAEWVEIFNPNSYSIQLAGMQIFANADNVLTLPEAQLGPNSYLKVVLPGTHLRNCSASCTFQLSIRYLDLELDKVVYSATSPGHSWSLDDSVWHLDYPASPGSQNLPPVSSATTLASSTPPTSAAASVPEIQAVNSQTPTSKYYYQMPAIYELQVSSPEVPVWRLGAEYWLLGGGICSIFSGLALFYWERIRHLDTTSIDHPV